MSKGHISLSLTYNGEIPVVSSEVEGIDYFEFVTMISHVMNGVVDTFSDGTNESIYDERVRLLRDVSKAMDNMERREIE